MRAVRNLVARKPTVAWLAAAVALALLVLAPSAAATEHARFNSRITQGGYMAPGDAFEHTFAHEGTYTYHSTGYGEFVNGAVLVHESYAQTGRVDVAIRDGGFHPDVVEIAPGASVRWTNQDSMNHTVHEDGDSPGPALPPVSPTPPGAGGGDAPGPGTAVAAAAGLAAAYAVRRRGCRG